MLGLVARLAAVVDGGPEASETAVDGAADGVFFTTRNDCRTCHAPIRDPRAAPTARDPSSPIATLAGATAPTATFCSEECRAEFVDVFHDGGGRA